MIRLLLVDDQTIVREYLKTHLAEDSDIIIVGEAENGKEAVEAAEKYKPDIILMDLEMPFMNGIEATERIIAYFDNIKVLLLTSREEKHLMNLALKAGTRGYIHKSASAEDLSNIIRLTISGYFQFGPIVNEYSYEEPHTSMTVTSHNGLETYQDSAIGDVLSDIAKNVMELKQTVASQENRTNLLISQDTQYNTKQKPRVAKGKFLPINNANFLSRRSSLSMRKQNLLFFSGFFLGLFAVLLLAAVYTATN